MLINAVNLSMLYHLLKLNENFYNNIIFELHCNISYDGYVTDTSANVVTRPRVQCPAQLVTTVSVATHYNHYSDAACMRTLIL